MDEKGDFDKADDVLLPGFRFHPTDEELVGFYLKRKIQHRPLPIELIKQVDIYKYDPWDLPKELATTGEKEWYFYCPRDRKYRNSTRPNRVTRAGFWKATGTDRPIYSSEGSKCIGLKKSLVFYRGRAAKGIKTDWMMHEFRLPSASDPVQPKKLLDKNLPANDSWAICRIFKKANTMAQRALSHSWITPPPATVDSTVFPNDALCTQFSPETISYTSDGRSLIQLCCTGSSNDLQQVSSAQYPSFYKPTDAASSNRPSQLPIPNGDLSAGGSHLFLPHEMPAPGKCSADVASMMLNMPPALAEDIARLSESINIEAPHQQQQQQQQQSNTCSINLLQGGMEAEELSEVMRKFSGGNPAAYNNNKHLGGNGRSIGFPFSLPNTVSEAWKPNLLWESLSPSPSDMSPSFSTNKCFT